MDLNIELCCQLKGYLIYCDVNVLISNNQKKKLTKFKNLSQHNFLKYIFQKNLDFVIIHYLPHVGIYIFFQFK
jgi:hypothetical protein